MTSDDPELVFIQSIDACFPYGDESAWRNAIRDGCAISPNAAFMVLHEIALPPRSVDTQSSQQFTLFDAWWAAFEHPLKDAVGAIARAAIEGATPGTERLTAALERLRAYPGQHNALAVVVGCASKARLDIDEQAERVKADWSETTELNARVRNLVRSPDNMQAFADLASVEQNWRRLDPAIAFPRSVTGHEDECPSCFETIRLIFDKFGGPDYERTLTCPHCTAELRCVGEFSGYTTTVHLEEA